jgi:glycosyltransferase involved in cell wall biosynthesis
MRAEVTLVGRPFAPIGVGEFLRATFRSLVAVGVDVRIRNLEAESETKEFQDVDDLRSRLVDRIDSEMSVFVQNGDEREVAFRRLGPELTSAGYKIVYPAWELARYPEIWARELEHYEEVWALSSFSAASFAASVRRPVKVMPLPCRPVLTQLLSRRHFGISESAFVFVFFFDLSSYIERKNPFALLEAMGKVRKARPYADFQVVLKMGSPHTNPPAVSRFLEALEPHRRHAVLIEKVLTSNEAKSLIRLGDAYVSLHRAEGFGFSPGEAMFYGRPVVATGFSGNMEYMTPETALLVDYKLIPVLEGQYPHATGQVWADPDVDQAAAHMIRLLDDPEAGRALGARASAHVRTRFSHRACGLRYKQRLDEISSVLTAAKH